MSELIRTGKLNDVLTYIIEKHGNDDTNVTVTIYINDKIVKQRQCTSFKAADKWLQRFNTYGF